MKLVCSGILLAWGGRQERVHSFFLIQIVLLGGGTGWHNKFCSISANFRLLAHVKKREIERDREGVREGMRERQRHRERERESEREREREKERERERERER